MFHTGFNKQGYFYFGIAPKWRKRFSRLWQWLTHPFRRKVKPEDRDPLEIALEKALKEMAGLPEDIKKTKDKDGWVTYSEQKKLFRTRERNSWFRPDSTNFPH